MAFFKTSVPSAGTPFARLSRSMASSNAADAPKEDDLDEAADEDDDDADEEDDGDTDENGKKTKKSKKTKKAEDDSDEDDEEKPEARAVRLREKARIRTILGSAAGKRLPDAARHLALNSSMPRHAAVKLLKTMNATVPQSRGGLRDRMAGVDAPDVGAGDTLSHAAPGDTKVTAAAIIAAGKKRRGEL